MWKESTDKGVYKSKYMQGECKVSWRKENMLRYWIIFEVSGRNIQRLYTMPYYTEWTQTNVSIFIKNKEKSKNKSEIEQRKSHRSKQHVLSSPA